MPLPATELDKAANGITLGSGTPATVYIAAYVGGSEVSGNGYSRVSRSNNTTEFPAASGGNALRTNANAITWPKATGDWGVIDEIRVHTHATNEAVIASSSANKEIEADDTLTMEAGALDISFANKP